MKKSFIVLFFLSFLMALGNIANATPISNSCKGKKILGNFEKVAFDRKYRVDAKLDTGAQMSSLSATNIRTFKNKGKIWVQFTVHISSQKKFTLTKPLVSYVRILKRTDEITHIKTGTAKQVSIRPVVKLQICLGNQSKEISINLTDRTSFRYPILIGSDALKNYHAIVDVSQKFLTQPRCLRN